MQLRVTLAPVGIHQRGKTLGSVHRDQPLNVSPVSFTGPVLREAPPPPAYPYPSICGMKMEILYIFHSLCRLNVERYRADAGERRRSWSRLRAFPSRRPRCAAPLGDARSSCARFPSFCSHFSLRSSQWQQPFTAQLTYAECLRPAGVSHPHAPRLSSRRSHATSDICYFISSDSSSTDLGYLRWFLSPREGGLGEKGDTCAEISPRRWSLSPSPLPPVSILFAADAQVRFTIRPRTFV